MDFAIYMCMRKNFEININKYPYQVMKIVRPR